MDMNDLFGDYQNGNYSTQQKTPIQENNFNDYANSKNNEKVKAPKAKKGGGLKVFFVLILLIGLIAGGFYVYAFTDVFKAPKELMVKYLYKMYQTVEDTTPLSHKIMNKKTGTAKVDGTLTLLLNKLSEGMVPDTDVKLKLDVDYDNKLTEIAVETELEGQKIDAKIITNKDKLAVGSSLVDITEEYDGKNLVGLKNENLKDFLRKLKYDEDALTIIPNKVNFDALENLFTDDEINDIKTRYLEILNTHLTEEMFSKENNIAVKVNGVEYKTTKVVLNMTSSQLLDLVVASLEELKNDTVILECYKKVVDIEIPKDAVNETFEEMLAEIKDNQESEKQAPSGTMQIATYIYKTDAIKLEALIFDENAKVLQETSYSCVKNDSGYVIISETITPEGEYSPSVTQKTTVNVENTPTSQKMTSKMEVIYGETPEDTYSLYENSSFEYEYVIKDFSEKGYNDSLIFKQENKEIVKFKSTVKFDEGSKATKLTDKNTVFLNDLTPDEIGMLFATVASKITGEDLMAELDPSFDEEEDIIVTDTPDEVLPEDDIQNPSSEDEVTEPSTGIYDPYAEEVPTVDSELRAALDICRDEAQKTEYSLADYLIPENITALCTTIESVEVEQATSTLVSFVVTGKDSKKYSFMVIIDGDDYGAVSIYEKSN